MAMAVLKYSQCPARRRKRKPSTVASARVSGRSSVYDSSVARYRSMARTLSMRAARPAVSESARRATRGSRGGSSR